MTVFQIGVDLHGPWLHYGINLTSFPLPTVTIPDLHLVLHSHLVREPFVVPLVIQSAAIVDIGSRVQGRPVVRRCQSDGPILLLRVLKVNFGVRFVLDWASFDFSLRWKLV